MKNYITFFILFILTAFNASHSQINTLNQFRGDVKQTDPILLETKKLDSLVLSQSFTNNLEILKVELVNEYKTPGAYSIRFNASKLNSGVYFYTLKAGDFTQTKKMLLVK